MLWAGGPLESCAEVYKRLGRVVQSLIKLAQDKREFSFEFCNLVQKFSIYIIWPSALSLKFE